MAWSVDGVYVVSGLVPVVTMTQGLHDISVLLTDLYGNEQTFTFEYEQPIYSTRILMPFTTTSGFTDVANNHAITVVGSPTISTAQSKFGAGALAITSNNYIKIDATPTLNFSGNKVFTIELWVYTTTYTGDTILSTRNASVYSPFLIGQQRSLIGNAPLIRGRFLPLLSQQINGFMSH